MRWNDRAAPGVRRPTLVPRRVGALLCVSAISFVLAVPGSPAWSAKEKRQPPQPLGPAGAELQTLIMRFADQVVFATITAFDQVRASLDTPEKRFVAFERQQVMASSAYLIATEADPDTALLDMIVLVTLERMAAERYWLPEYFGEVATWGHQI